MGVMTMNVALEEDVSSPITAIYLYTFLITAKSSNKLINLLNCPTLTKRYNYTVYDNIIRAYPPH